VVGCVAVHPYAEEKKAELACLFVKKGHTDQGYGRLLIEAATNRARELGAPTLFALSTQAAGYLQREGFSVTDELSELPNSRRKKWQTNGRNALVLTRKV
jgi:amino-acid N-acetyltransferase